MAQRGREACGASQRTSGQAAARSQAAHPPPQRADVSTGVPRWAGTTGTAVICFHTQGPSPPCGAWAPPGSEDPGRPPSLHHCPHSLAPRFPHSLNPQQAPLMAVLSRSPRKDVGGIFFRPGFKDLPINNVMKGFSLQQKSLCLVLFPLLPWLPGSSALHSGPTTWSLCLLFPPSAALWGWLYLSVSRLPSLDMCVSLADLPTLGRSEGDSTFFCCKSHAEELQPPARLTSQWALSSAGSQAWGAGLREKRGEGERSGGLSMACCLEVLNVGGWSL